MAKNRMNINNYNLPDYIEERLTPVEDDLEVVDINEIFNEKNVKLKCPSCKSTYEVEYPSFIRVPQDKKQKQDLLSGRLFNHECPNCHHIDFHAFALTYVDDENKAVVIGNFYANALITKLEMKDNYLDYKFYIVEEPMILLDAINSIDHHIDPLVMEFIKYDKTKRFELKKDDYIIWDTHVRFSEDGSVIKLVFDVENSKLNRNEMTQSITSELYNKYEAKVERYKKGADLSVLSPHYVNKLYQLAKNLEIEEAKSVQYEILQCRDKYDNAQLVLVQYFNEGKFKVGDKVAALDYHKGSDKYTIYIQKVERIIHMTDIEYIVDIEVLPVAVYKVGSMQFETTMDSDAELDNGHLKDIILSDFKSKEYDTFFNSNVIIPMTVEMSVEGLREAINEDNISLNSLTHKFKTVEIGEYKYFALYLDQADVKDEKVGLKVVVDFKTALCQYFSIADQYDGIVLNPETDNIWLSTGRLLNIMADKTMTNSKAMIDFIFDATKEEIEYIGVDKFNLIKEVYTSDIGLAAILEKLNLSTIKADYMLGDGYRRIKNILRSKELLKMPIENCN